MEGEMIASNHSNSSETNTSSSLETISILVVDDDTTCLSIVAAILKKWKYEVVTVKHPIDALCTLRIKGGSFDLVVSDVHMPDMDGFQLQQLIDEEFHLPVVLMSADDKEGVIMKGLQSGAAFFIVKPVSPDDLRDLWQYAAAKKKSKVVLEDIGSIQEKFSSDQESASALSANKDSQIKRGSKRKFPGQDNNHRGGDNANTANVKKAKVIWTNELHNRFLEAIKAIGLEKAVPKKILELMKVPGITRENVASHLQKYRIFLKRVSDASYKLQAASDNSVANKRLRITHGPEYSSMILNQFPKVCHQIPEQQPLRVPLQQQYGLPSTALNNLNSGDVSFTDQEALCCNTATPSLNGKSLLLSYLGNQQTVIGKDNFLYQVNTSSFGTEPKAYETGFSSHKRIFNGIMTGTNSMQMYPALPPGAPNNIETSSMPGLIQKVNYHNRNHVSYPVACGEHAAGSGDYGDPVAEASSSFHIPNRVNENNNITAERVMSINPGDMTPGLASSTWSETAKQLSLTRSYSIQQETLPAIQPQLSRYEYELGEMDPSLGSANESSMPSNITAQQQYIQGDLGNNFLSQGGLGNNFLSQVNTQSASQLQQMQDGEEHPSSALPPSSYIVQDNPIVNDQRQQGCGGFFDYQTYSFADTLPSSHLSCNKVDNEEFLESFFGPGPDGGSVNLGTL